jgi:ABC-2 type transport system permease protein
MLVSHAAFAFARAAFQQHLTYRVANLAGLFTNGFFLVMRAYVFEACYVARDSIGGLSMAEAVTFASVTQCMLMVSPQWGAIGVGANVRSGQIAVDLLRPVDLVTATLAGRLGVSAYYAVVRMLPMLALAAALGILQAPSPGGLLAFLVTLALGALLANAILFLVEVSSFWIESERGVRYVVMGVALLPSGLLIPVTWFPEPLESLFRLTPFTYTMNLPAEAWLGTADLGRGLAVQLAWLVGILAACGVAVRAGTRRLQVHGG